MATIHASIVNDLYYLNIIKPTYTGQWPKREFKTWEVNLANAIKLGIGSKGTCYNWLRNPPPYFVQSLRDKVELQRELERSRAYSVPKHWHTAGWWFDDSGRLVYGSNYANACRFDQSDILAIWMKEKAYKLEIQGLKNDIKQLNERLRVNTAANDRYYYG